METKQLPPIFSTLDKIKPVYDWTYKVFMLICKLLLIADILLTCVAVVARYVAQFTGYIIDSSWCEQIVLTCMIYMAVLSASLAIRRGAHIRMTAFDEKMPVVALRILDLLADISVIILAVVMIKYGMEGALKQWKNSYESILWLSRFWRYFPIPLAGIAMIVFELESVYNHIKAFFLPEPESEVAPQ